MPPMTHDEEAELARLLDRHSGDRWVYLESPGDRPVFQRALRLGLVDDEGLLTSTGYRLWQRVTARGGQAHRRPRAQASTARVA